MTTTPDRNLTVDEKLALDAAGLDMDLDLMRTAGLALGSMMGRARTARAVLLQAVKDAFDGEAEYAAGLFREVRDDELPPLEEDPVAIRLGLVKPKQPTIVVLCGSTRFSAAFRDANLEETLAGNIVLSIGCDMRTDTDLFAGCTDEQIKQVKADLDELHKRKIDLADEVLVLNVGGYIDQSTRSEIDYAISLGKPIRWLEPPTEDTPDSLAERMSRELPNDHTPTETDPAQVRIDERRAVRFGDLPEDWQ